MCLKNFILIVFLFIGSSAIAQSVIAGRVTDKNGIVISGANITLAGTIEGTTTNSEGKFSFKTQAKDSIKVVISYIGYERWIKSGKAEEFANLNVILQESGENLNEVVIRASSFNLGRTKGLKEMDALDIVMMGSSNGDIYRALQSLPGTNIVGEDGKLYVRGGDERESQTFIDGMHVLSAYNTTAQNVPARGRFSPFLFKGINFSTGGYESEYGQALSSVLPMYTKDISKDNKFGLNFSPLSAGCGGTYLINNISSISVNLNYMNLSFYNKVFPDKYDWKKHYNILSSEAQYKSKVGKNGSFKIYGSFDKTSFIRSIVDTLNNIPTRDFNLSQGNYYINSTYKSKTKKDVDLFFGTAFSYVNNLYNNVSFQKDKYKEILNELHIKVKASKFINNKYKASIGAEDYANGYENSYTDTLGHIIQNKKKSSTIIAAFVDNEFRITNGLFGNLSGRLEYADFNKNFIISPRFSLSYIKNGLQISGTVGKYNQIPQIKYILLSGSSLRQESTTHYIFSTSYEYKGLFLKAEAYIKQYNHLAWLNKNVYTSGGNGKSAGIDIYVTDESLIKNFKYDISYSFNDSKRLYANFPVEIIPPYTTKHNARFSFRYYVAGIKSYFGISNSFTSGRPYTNPNSSNTNNFTKPYYSLDGNISTLLSKSLIVYTSVTNILNRVNQYGYTYSKFPNVNGYYRSAAIESSRDRFFYIGLFISLNKNSAYDVSNF